MACSSSGMRWVLLVASSGVIGSPLSGWKRARCFSGSHSSTDGGNRNPVCRSIVRKLLSYEVILRELGESLVKVSSGLEALEHLLENEAPVPGADGAHSPDTNSRRSTPSVHSDLILDRDIISAVHKPRRHESNHQKTAQKD